MEEILLKLWPIFAGFGAAFAAKKLGLLKAEYAGVLLKFAFYVTIPALVFVSVARLGFSNSLLMFPLLPAIILLVTFPVALWVARRLHLPRSTEGTLRVAPMTINSGLSLVFLAAVFGAEGVTRVVLFNVGFNPLLFIVVYGLAASYNPHSKRRRDVAKRIFLLPPLWAFILGLIVNATNTTLPASLTSGLELIGGLTLAVTVAALGLSFNPRHLRLDKTMAIVGVRIGIGLLVGLAVCVALQLEGIDRAAVLALCAAPIGFNLLTFASTEKLDQELAANAISLSIIVGLVLLPLILLFAAN